MVKLDDSTPTSDKNGCCQYYATKTIKEVFRSIGVREKPGDKIVCGETGLPITPTADSAVQSCSDDFTEDSLTVNVNSAKDDDVATSNCKSSSPSNKNLDDVIPLQLTATNDQGNVSASITSLRSSISRTSTNSNDQSEGVLDFSLKMASEGETQTNSEEAAMMDSSASPDNSSNDVVMETEHSPIVALLQRPGLLPLDSER